MYKIFQVSGSDKGLVHHALSVCLRSGVARSTILYLSWARGIEYKHTSVPPRWQLQALEEQRPYAAMLAVTRMPAVAGPAGAPRRPTRNSTPHIQLPQRQRRAPTPQAFRAIFRADFLPCAGMYENIVLALVSRLATSEWKVGGHA